MVVPSTPYDQLVLLGAPVAYWPMYEPSNTQHDLSGNANDLLLSHGSIEARQQGLYFGECPGGSLRQGSDFTCTPISPAAVTAPFSAELWIEYGSNAVSAALSTRTPNDFGFQIGFDASGGFSCTIGNGLAFLAVITIASPNLGIFARIHHVVLTVSAAAWILYLDGQQVATGVIAAGAVLYNATHHVIVGSYNGALNFINSLVARVALYNYVLSAANVLNHFSNGLSAGGAQPGTIVTLAAADLNAILNSVRKTF